MQHMDPSSEKADVGMSFVASSFYQSNLPPVAYIWEVDPILTLPFFTCSIAAC